MIYMLDTNLIEVVVYSCLSCDFRSLLVRIDRIRFLCGRSPSPTSMPTCSHRLTYYLTHGYVHGIRYLGQRSGRPWKFVWAAVLLVLAVCMARSLRSTLQDFDSDVVDLNLDTAYLHWTNTFPALAICLARGSSVLNLAQLAHADLERRQAAVPPNFHRYVKTLHDYLFLNPTVELREFEYCAGVNGSCGVDIEAFRAQLMPTHCAQFMVNVSFLGRPVADCADLFRYTVTEMGVCFVANSLAM